MRNGIICKLVSENLSAFIDEELEREFSDEIKKHLCDCLDCRRKFSKLLKLHYLLRKYFDGGSFKSYKHDLMSNLRFIKNFDFVHR
jgi:hypothetical protein